MPKLVAVFRRYGVARCFTTRQKKKLHSVITEREFKVQPNMAQEGIGISTKPTKAAKDIKKAKETNLEDREKGWREKPLH